MNTCICFFIIAAFSKAILRIVSPKIFVCSRLIEVITTARGLRTLVASSLPPKPVSITAKSTLCSAKYLKAIAVVTSKNVNQL